MLNIVSILKRIAPAVALLGILMVSSLPTAQSMTLNPTDGGSSKEKVQTVSFTKTPLSTKENPTIIRNTVHIAWLSGEFQWSSKSEWACFDQIIWHESSWSPWADNGAGWEETGGIPQAHPSNKMAEAGKDYRTNVWTQVKWGLDYIESTYGTPCNAWDKWQERAANGSYGWY